jgi:hypothetical protein
MKMTLITEHHDGSKITHELPRDIWITDAIQEFETFLRASGYIFEGNLGIVGGGYSDIEREEYWKVDGENIGRFIPSDIANPDTTEACFWEGYIDDTKHKWSHRISVCGYDEKEVRDFQFLISNLLNTSKIY